MAVPGQRRVQVVGGVLRQAADGAGDAGDRPDVGVPGTVGAEENPFAVAAVEGLAIRAVAVGQHSFGASRGGFQRDLAEMLAHRAGAEDQPPGAEDVESDDVDGAPQERPGAS